MITNLKWIFVCLAALFSMRAVSSVLPDSLEVEIDSNRPHAARIKANYSVSAGEYCLIQNLNTNELLENHLPMKSLDLWYQRTSRTHLLSSSSEIIKHSKNLKFEKQDVNSTFRKLVINEGGKLTLEIEAEMPHHAFFTSNEIVFYNYVPFLNKKCEPRHSKNIKGKIRTKIKVPEGWEVLSPFRTTPPQDQNVVLEGFHPDFVLGRHYKHETLKSDSLTLQLYYRTEEYKNLLPIIKKNLGFYTKNLGALPLKNLIVFESDHTTRSNILGLFAYLKPRQEFLKSLQEYWLNWSEWSTTASLSYQWFGSLLETKNEDDDWLTHSLRDYYVLKALQSEPNAFNLFNSFRQSLFDFKYTYLDFQDLTAFSLIASTPKARLTHANFKTLVRLRHQNPLVFIRNVMAMRNLEAVIGFQKLNDAIRSFFKNNESPGLLRPPEFADRLVNMLKKSNPATASLTENILVEWWTKIGWPDRSLYSVEEELLHNGKYVVQFQIKEEGQLLVPSDIYLWDVKGKKYVLPASSQNNANHTYKLILDNKLDQVTVDPYRIVFDQNRFNNSSEWPGFYFFPGNARELYQDSYTVFWLPMAVKRPGEDLRFGIQSSILKYLRGNFLFSFEADAQGKRTTFDFQHEQETNVTGFQYAFGALKNFFNLRQAYLQLSFKDINASSLHPLNFYLVGRAKQEGSDNETLHGTLGAGAILLPGWRPEPCNFVATAEHEQTPSEQGEKKLHYERTYGWFEWLCNITNQVQFKSRVFRGVTKSIVSAPLNSFFWPQNLGEAKVRFDFPPNVPHEWINSTNNDLLLPLYFPFDIGSYVLTQKMRFKLFYDYAEASRDTIYRSAGFGFILPIGGDVTGAGSLAVTRLSLLSVIYQSVNQKKYPNSILFDITGDL